MEGSGSWEQKTLIGELIQGMELANQLRYNLSSKGSLETREFLVQRILGSYEKALLLLECGGSNSKPLPPQQRSLGVVTCLSVPESPISATESPRSDDQDSSVIRDSSKKRKALPRWTDQVRVNSENGLEGPQDDGYSWRKYGQKDILGAKYPRSYYRCTFRNTQSCWATKQVQRSDEDPFLFDITYRGNHTCSQAGHSVQPPNSPQKEDQKPNNTNNSIVVHQPQFEDTIQNIPSNLRVVTEGLDNRENVTVASSFSFPSSSYNCFKVEDGFSSHMGLENEAFLGAFSQQFASPATPESGYYSASPFAAGFHLNGGRPSESDIISADTSTTNSPIPEMDFSLDQIQVEIDPNFPFNTPGGFFS